MKVGDIMKIKDIIKKKNKKEALTKEEIEYVVNDYTNGKIKDKDMTLFLKAVCEHKMNEEETIELTRVMIDSGDLVDLSKVEGVKADKHSTGGVGDKTTLIVGPIVAVCGVNVAKMSGRALGFTGGTIDKLESIPGFKVDLTIEQFIKQLQDIKMALTSQTEDLVKADKKIYALRDVTNTVGNVSLIASSIMSKKIAMGAEVIVLDVKVGNGAYASNIEEAKELANLMIKIGKSFDRKMVAIISNMNEPLGYNIGNALEVEEAISVLKGEGNESLVLLCNELATYMVMLAKNISYAEAIVEVEEAFHSGKAYHKFLEWIKVQGGDVYKLPKAEYKFLVTAKEEGYVKTINTKLLGEYAHTLGSGRKKKEDKIDYAVGLKLFKKIGDKVKPGDSLLEIYANKEITDIATLEGFMALSREKITPEKVIIEIIK